MTKTYDIFRCMPDGGAPLWISDLDNLDVAKMEAWSLAAKNHARYIVFDLVELAMKFDTGDAPTEVSPTVAVRASDAERAA